jgi:signal transduction histidine kinase
LLVFNRVKPLVSKFAIGMFGAICAALLGWLILWFMGPKPVLFLVMSLGCALMIIWVHLEFASLYLLVSYFGMVFISWLQFQPGMDLPGLLANENDVGFNVWLLRSSMIPIAVWGFTFVIDSFMSEYLKSIRKVEVANNQMLFLRQNQLSCLLARGICHDLNNLFTPLLGNLDYLRENIVGKADSDPIDLQLVDENIEITNSAIQLLSSLMHYSSDDAVTTGPLSLTAVIEGFKPVFRSIISRRYAIDYLLEPDLPKIKSNENQIFQIMANLLQNAAEAMAKEGNRITISTSSGPYSFTTSGGPGMPNQSVRLEVSDNGPGIEKQVLDRIFELNFSTKKKGTGVGLAAVKSIIELNHGEIHVTSVPGKGTSLVMHFPVKDQQ